MENQNTSNKQASSNRFRLVQRDGHLTDQRLETKRIGYFGDVWRRFKQAGK